ncbi:MAG TPA: alkaline phosphatase family protein [Solirubrobacteraceae bacterium]|jgi:phospholipase C|nr:alkaline phosphatase family protein [Solirubrobacteraceae bacterium]
MPAPRRRKPLELPLTRRDFVRYGGSVVAGLSAGGTLLRTAAAAGAMVRAPGSLPDPKRAAGTPTEALPFDHIVVVMMENHSFDNLLGALAHAGQPKAHGLHFDAAGNARNHNPDLEGKRVRAFPFTTTEQDHGVSQSWNATHEQIDGGKMDGFIRSTGSTQSMGYWTEDVLPFAYSFARSFTLANRWFCSAPCQTYPNRRFLMAGTAYGDVSTDSETLQDPPPPNGTIFDRLSAYGISWRNYFTDLPQTAIIPSIIEKYPTHLASTAQFYLDCATGTLPSVSFVDPEFGAISEIGAPLTKVPGLEALGAKLEATGGDEEAPQDLSYGEDWAYTVVNAVLNSPAWPRTLLIYTYDEHGGYYDHVKPPAAIAPDAIPPSLGPEDFQAGYDQYGPRVPGIVASPYSKPNAVTNVVHDHTSVLATIEAKWNLPAMTYRDANARTVADFLDLKSPPALLEPPTIAKPPAPTGFPGAK